MKSVVIGTVVVQATTLSGAPEMPITREAFRDPSRSPEGRFEVPGVIGWSGHGTRNKWPSSAFQPQVAQPQTASSNKVYLLVRSRAWRPRNMAFSLPADVRGGAC